MTDPKVPQPTRQLGQDWKRRDLFGLAGATAALSLGAGADPARAAELLSFENFENGPGSILVAASDAPAPVRDVAHYRCDGTADQETINQAINSLAPTGGCVRLSEGTFFLSGAVRLRRRTRLIGKGRSTVLRAVSGWMAFDGSTHGGILEPHDDGTDKTSISNLFLDGNRYGSGATKGIYYQVNRNDEFDEGPDAHHIFTDITVSNTRYTGVHILGGRMRATYMTRVRVWNAGLEGDLTSHGFHHDSPDSFYHQCETGSSGGHGFLVEGANNRFTNCKAWYSDGSGFFVQTPRNQFAACESQDNEQHGFYIASGPNSFVGCHADSNSWKGDGPVSRYDGFHIPAAKRVQLIGCSAYDKNEQQRGNWQRYGLYLGSAARHIQAIMTVADNKSGGVGGAGAGDASNLLMVAG